MNKNKVYICDINQSIYPSKSNCFGPSTAYPEYKFKDNISEAKNDVYDMIRECLFHMGFDQDNYGKANWNPLKDLIKPGEVVLLKPNMVLHENEIPQNGMECLITHPSLVRAMLDYVILALDGVGTIIVGDAPLQSCDFDRLVKEQGYTDIIEFYKSKGINIELVDFRNYKTVLKNGLLNKVESDECNQAVIVDLKNKSEFVNLGNDRMKRLRITNYDHSIMYNHHNSEKNEYSIAKKILDADVIINMPKPKTHRKAGVTISLKNLVGINTNKEWLPHHTEGSSEEGGDEYKSKNFAKKKMTYYIEKKDKYMVSGNYCKANLARNMARGFSVINKFIFKEKYSEGSWHGNDTIWRTIMDLNKILFYADKNGNMCNTKQRKMLIVSDMIISGEKEGPLLPTPKEVGIIAMALNPVCMDEALSAIMGFNHSLIPSINNSHKIVYYNFCEDMETIIRSNNSLYDSKKPHEIEYEDSKKFIPSLGWQGYLNQ